MNLWTLMILATLTACGSATTKEDKDNSNGPDIKVELKDVKDTSLEGIKNFIKNGEYKNWKKDSTIYQSEGPHGLVRVYYNDTLIKALNANVKEMPVGAIAVKEIFESDKKTVKAWALEAKVEAGTGGNTWLWYEGFNPALNQYYGKGLGACTGCHASGTDYVIAKPK